MFTVEKTEKLNNQADQGLASVVMSQWDGYYVPWNIW